MGLVVPETQIIILITISVKDKNGLKSGSDKKEKSNLQHSQGIRIQIHCLHLPSLLWHRLVLVDPKTRHRMQNVTVTLRHNNLLKKLLIINNFFPLNPANQSSLRLDSTVVLFLQLLSKHKSNMKNQLIAIVFAQTTTYFYTSYL